MRYDQTFNEENVYSKFITFEKQPQMLTTDYIGND